MPRKIDYPKKAEVFKRTQEAAKKKMVEHLNNVLDDFQDTYGKDRTPEEYLTEYWNKGEPGEVYYWVCNDLDLKPVV